MLKLHKEEGVTYTSCIIFLNIVQATIIEHKSNGLSRSLHTFGYQNKTTWFQYQISQKQWTKCIKTHLTSMETNNQDCVLASLSSIQPFFIKQL